ncbi:MAG: hypothetical protein AAF495_13135 [Pseudomonadota bacterium]
MSAGPSAVVNPGPASYAGEEEAREQMDRQVTPKLLYITYSSHSGSTLLSLLLNTHPDIMAIGHMTGWPFPEDEEFRCSCGELIEDCPFYRSVMAAYEAAGLRFDPRDFGTDYKLSQNFRLNRYLIGSLPLVQSAAAERLRDRLLGLLPSTRAMIARTDRANLLFVETAQAYSGAKVIVDKSTRSHRVRFLKNVPGLELHAIHLIQDPRSVIYSDIAGRNWSAARGIENWLSRNRLIFHNLSGVQRKMTVFYEDLTDRTDQALAAIHRFVGLAPRPFPGDFKIGEHHVLGNEMRHGSSKIQKDVRWRSNLSAGDLAQIEGQAWAFAKRHGDHPLSGVIRHYLEA